MREKEGTCINEVEENVMVLTYRTLLFVLSLMMLLCFEASKSLGPVFFYSVLGIYMVAVSFILYKLGKIKRNKRLR